MNTQTLEKVRLWRSTKSQTSNFGSQTLESWRTKAQKQWMLSFDRSEDQAMVLEMSKGQWMSLSLTDNEGQQCKTTTSTSNIPMCIVRSYKCVSIGKEWLIPYQGKDSNSFLRRTLTKSSNKSMMNDQASQLTLWCADTV